MNYWADLFKLFGGVAAAIALLTYLVKILVSHFLSKDLEAYKTEGTKEVEAFKADLAAKNDKAIEVLKARLDVLAQESIIRFTKLHEKRVKILSEMYSLLEDAQVSMGFLEAGCKVEGELTKEFVEMAAEKNRKLFPFFNKNKLYFSSELANKIFTVISGLHSSASDLVIVVGGDQTPEKINKRRAEFIEKWPEENMRLLKVMSSIEAEFRSILTSEPNPSTENPSKH